MARFIANATGRTLAETVKTGTKHLLDKDMPKALAVTRGNRFSSRPNAKRAAPAATPDAEPVADDAQE